MRIETVIGAAVIWAPTGPTHSPAADRVPGAPRHGLNG